ncbi:MAG TPA: CHAT domain-containing protein [Steroidobacteraceae bacterium]|nr:CHAT domain-containing protein [Steroidobacteraceae bacterium]
MASATLKIFALDQAQAGYPAELTEDGKAPVKGLLPAAAFVSGKWTVALNVPGAPAPPARNPGDPAPRDIVETVVRTPGQDRANVDWNSLSAALFEMLFPVGPLRTAYAQLDDTRLFLDIEPAELERVPWELAKSSNPTRRLSLNYTQSRLTAAPRAAARPTSDWPFRILIFVGCSPTDEGKLQVDKEIEAIRRVFIRFGRSVDVRVESRLTLEELSAVIKGGPKQDRWEPHVFHFVGHTGVLPDDSYGLAIDRSETDGASWVWSQESIQQDLDLLEWTPTFVFLNACRTADEPAATWTMQRSFIQAGARCALTMQADVAGEIAGKFAGKFYEQIAAGDTVQEAVAEARGVVYRFNSSTTVIDWGLPSLTTTETETKLFTPRARPPDPGYAKCQEFDEARIFANCEPSRRLLTHWMCPVRAQNKAAESPNVVVLTGPARCGKSHLLKWAMESWVLSGALVRYFELNDGSPRNFLSILRQIRDGDGKGGARYLQRQLPVEAFKRCNWTMKNLLANGQPGEWIEAEHPEAEIPDDPKLQILRANGEDRLEPAICAEFHAALRSLAEKQPVVLVFNKVTDGVTRLVSPDDFAQLVTHLFKPIALEKDGRVKLVFSVSDVERDAYSLRKQDLPQLAYEVPANMDNDALVNYAVEMLRFSNADYVRQLADLLLKMPDEKQRVGMARLGKIRETLNSSYFADIERMQ